MHTSLELRLYSLVSISRKHGLLKAVITVLENKLSIKKDQDNSKHQHKLPDCASVANRRIVQEIEWSAKLAKVTRHWTFPGPIIASTQVVTEPPCTVTVADHTL